MYNCQNCNKPATYFIKTNINGSVYTTALCSECAAKHEINTSMTNIDNLSSFFNPFFLGADQSIPEIKRCPSCGTSFKQICDSSKYGCPDCYATFKKESEFSLKKLHRELQHKGKIPKSAPIGNSQNELENLKSQLADAVADENYEKAAQLRDKIKLINSQKGGK